MSVKSLLQIILFLLIVLIVGGIYFLYFYTTPINKQNEMEIVLDISEKNIAQSKNDQQEVLEELEISDQKKSSDDQKTFLKLEDNNKSINQLNTNKLKTDIDQKIIGENLNVEKIQNLTKEIEYIISKENGDIYKINAKYGRTNPENSSVLDLEIVEGIISSNIRSKIFISSDKAKYNYSSQDSKFYKNVEIKYDGKIITCDSLDLLISENIAVAYNNVMIKDQNSLMKAQVITLDILTKDIKINSEDKVKVFTK